MSKNNYYYKTLAQSIIFSEDSWQDIVDPNEPHDNIFTQEFISALTSLLIQYDQDHCLEEKEKKRVLSLLNDLRFSYPYQTRTERKFIFADINDLIRFTNGIDDKQVNAFFRREYEKRYGRYFKFDCFKEVSYLLFSEVLKEGPEGIKFELSQDIYSLILLFHPIEDLSEEEIMILVLSNCFLSTVNALEVEYPSLLKDPIIRNRFLWILRKNRELFQDPNFKVSDEHDTDIRTRLQSKLLEKRLEGYSSK